MVVALLESELKRIVERLRVSGNERKGTEVRINSPTECRLERVDFSQSLQMVSACPQITRFDNAVGGKLSLEVEVVLQGIGELRAIGRDPRRGAELQSI